MRTVKSKARSNPRVTHVAVASRPLIEIGPEHLVWRALAAGKSVSFSPMQLTAAIAKVTPPAGTQEADVLNVENALYAGGARAVRRMPAPPEDKVVAEEVPEAELQAPQRTLTQVAVDRARRATSLDVDALVQLVELAMAKGER